MKFIKLLLTALLAAFALAACSGGNSPDGVAKTFMTAAYKGEIDKAMALVYIPEDMTATKKEAANGKLRMILAGAKDGADKRGGLVRVEVIDVETDSNNADRARVNLRVHFKDGQKTENAKLIRVKGKWLVNL